VGLPCKRDTKEKSLNQVNKPRASYPSMPKFLNKIEEIVFRQTNKIQYCTIEENDKGNSEILRRKNFKANFENSEIER
jgi:hypothetical protein